MYHDCPPVRKIILNYLHVEADKPWYNYYINTLIYLLGGETAKYIYLQPMLMSFSPYIDIVMILFHILVLDEYWILKESRIPLKPVLGGVRIVALSITSHDSIKPGLLFSYIVGSLYF